MLRQQDYERSFLILLSDEDQTARSVDGGPTKFIVFGRRGKTMHLNPTFGKAKRYTDVRYKVGQALSKAKTREHRIYLLAQNRAHRRIDKYCAVVRYMGENGEPMPWKISKHTRAWRLVRESTALVKKLRKYDV